MKYNMENYILEVHECKNNTVITRVTDLDRNFLSGEHVNCEGLRKLEFPDAKRYFCDRIEFYDSKGYCYMVFYNEELEENIPLTFGENGEALSPQEYGDYVILVDPNSLEVKQISYIG